MILGTFSILGEAGLLVKALLAIKGVYVFGSVLPLFAIRI